MWAELIFSRDDLATLLAEALPLKVHLGGDANANEGGSAEHSLTLSELGEVTLVAEVGLRVVCKACVRWPLLGIDVPVTIKSLTIVLLPTVEESEDRREGDRLVFRASIEHADFAGLPTLIDDRITAAINAKLATKGAELSWKFTQALTYNAALPGLLEPLASFAIRPAWGKVRITDDAVVYAASFHSAIVRRGDPVPATLAPFPPVPRAVAAPEAAAPPATLTKRPDAEGEIELDTALFVVGGAFALAAGAAFLLVRSAFRPRLLRY